VVGSALGNLGRWIDLGDHLPSFSTLHDDDHDDHDDDDDDDDDNRWLW
jgi:hypothetical protein